HGNGSGGGDDLENAHRTRPGLKNRSAQGSPLYRGYSVVDFEWKDVYRALHEGLPFDRGELPDERRTPLLSDRLLSRHGAGMVRVSRLPRDKKRYRREDRGVERARPRDGLQRARACRRDGA